MQTLYIVDAHKDTDAAQAKKRLESSIYNAHLAFLYCLQFITELAQQVELESHMRKNKYLPTAEDLQFPITFFQNSFVHWLMHNNTLTLRLRREKLNGNTEEDITKLIYQQLKTFAPYKVYVAMETHDADSDKKIVEDVFAHFLLKNEYFDEHMESIIPTWADDEFIVKGLMEDFFKAKSPEQAERSFQFHISDEEKDFSETLVLKTLEEDQLFDGMIGEKLQNWELDRVSVIDRILMKMALTEFLFIPTVPTKVTINEYLDISKLYSTPRSREFINGILDKLMNELKADGRIVKTGRGLIE